MPWPTFKDSRRSNLILLGLALVFVLLNAVKPPHVDDVTYWFYARHIADHPADPYGFALLNFEWSNPANHVLSPPVLPYWWALGIRLFGSQPLLWKLWLFPFALALVFALYWLARRFATGLELPVVCMTVLSPALLPSFNLMLDVPALALGLLALALFLRGCDRDSRFLAIVAGLVGGLAAQTKYTALTVPAVILLYSILVHKWRAGALALLVLGLVFAGWESFVAWRYSESHFMHHVIQKMLLPTRPTMLEQKKQLIVPLFAYVGGLAPYLIPLGLVGLRRRTWFLCIVAVIIILGYAVVIFAPGLSVASIRIEKDAGPGQWSWYDCVFGTFGVLVFALAAVAAWQLNRPLTKQPASDWHGWVADQSALFLTIWLLLELVGYFPLSPFAAARRVLGIIVVATLLIARLASRDGEFATLRRRASAVALLSLVLGLGFYGVDLREAQAEKQALEATVARIQREDPHPRIWYVGVRGFQFYAEQAGMRQVVRMSRTKPVDSHAVETGAIPMLPPTVLRKGDWLVVPYLSRWSRVPSSGSPWQGSELELVDELHIADALPVQTVDCYYVGTTPLERHLGWRVAVRLLRVKADFVPS